MEDKYNNVLDGFAQLCKDNDLTDDQMIKVLSTILGFSAKSMGIASVSTPYGEILIKDTLH
tara:strand:- start:44 stop:226 length:183 start_codon:yes stop_codon:yes gene_type:complete